MKQVLLLLVSFCVAMASAQNATVNKETINVVCKSDNSKTMNIHKEITIHNKQADDLACFIVGLERKSIELSAFSGVITDANGKVIKKVKKSDLLMSEYSSNFKTNAYTMAYSYTPPQFPVHVTYDYTLEFSNLVVSFGALAPLPDYNVNVEEASYSLAVPEGMQVRYNVRNTDAKVEKNTEQVDGKPMTVYRVAMHDIPAMKDEPCAPLSNMVEPSVEFLPVAFNCYGSRGSFGSWETLGKWNWQLWDGRQVIPASLAAEVDKAVAEAPDRKIEQCCALMRRITRYVSIQLGIGGWQPELASATAQTGFGDCKALTCLLMGVLEHAGVKSYPVIVNTEQKKLERDYPSLNQCNHVFLCVPQEKDTLWIECTNFTYPVGYRHDGMAGHDAVILTPEGGHFVTIPDYASEENLWTSDISITPQVDGRTAMEIRHQALNAQFEPLFALTFEKEQEQKKALLNKWNLGRVEEFRQFEMKAEEGRPAITTTISTESTGYATLSGTRMIIPTNPLHIRHSILPVVKDRTQDVSLRVNYEDKEMVHIAIPEGYAIETMPKPMDIDTPFGHLMVEVEVKDNMINLVYDLVRYVHEGGKDEYQAVCDFEKQIHTAYGQKIILKQLNN